ncbi:MAG: 3D domain-containing protein [Candidatus Zixiibacteriota bacterium]
METKKKKIRVAITLAILTLIFLASQNVQESMPESAYRPDQLLSVVDSLQKELGVFKEREILLLKHVRRETCTVTAYLPIDSMEGRHSGLTAIGTVARPYVTVAVDPTVVPINSWIWIDGLGWWKAEDTGNMVKGKRIDLCVSTREVANEFGIRKMRIKILK